MQDTSVRLKAERSAPGFWHVLRVMAVLFVITGILAVCQALTPTAAQASSPSCFGMTCEGLDPAQTSCTKDAVTIQSTAARLGPGNASYGHLEMRYSKSCHSNWVRYTGWSGPAWYINWFITGSDVWASPYIWRYGVDGTLQGPAAHSSLASSGSPTFWSKMVTADGTTCSSVELAASIPSESGYGASDLDELGAYNAPCIS